jgi:RNA polymerase sigma factor (sigma-70 family)
MTGPADILRRLEQGGPSDRDLLARFTSQRDQAAFAELVRRHGSLVLGVCRRVTGHADDADDAFQAVFLVLARKAGRIARPDLLGNWLYGVAVRVASRARRSAARRRAREVAVSSLPDPARECASGLPDLGPILDEELAALPEWYREAILLCDLRGVSREEAALILGVPEGTVSSRLANGRKKLAARLARRGVSLSVAGLVRVVGQAQAGVSVPNELLTKTCGLVADWSAGGAVPGPLMRLAEGGFAVRKTLLFGVLMLAAAAGAVVAAGSGDQRTPVEPPKQAHAAKAQPDARGRGEEKAAERPAYTSQPRMRLASDLTVGNLQSIRWSPDGTLIAVQGRMAVMGQGHVAVVAVTAPWLRPNGGELPASAQFPLGANSQLIGFTPSGNGLITDQREYQLVSGYHRLRFMKTEFTPERAVVHDEEPRMIDLDSDETHGYALMADGKAYRTIAFERDGTGAPRKIAVREVDTSTGKTVKSLMKIDHAQHALSPNGKRLAALDKDGNVVMYDVDRGARLSAHAMPEASSLPPIGATDPRFGGNFAQAFGGSPPPSEGANLVFSPDASKLVVSRTIGQTVVIDVQTGKPLPALEGSDMMRTRPAAHAFTGDGRLLAMTGTHYTVQKLTSRNLPAQFKQERDVLSPGRNFLTVWDTQTGKVVKSWDRSPFVAFNPARPVLAILEPNGENTTRLGLWDFSAEVEKK